MAILTIFLLLAAAQTVKVDQYPLRSGCSENSPVVARLHAGDPVQIRFSLAGATQPCYVVSAVVDGKTVEGNLPADAMTGLEDFERARRAAAPVNVSVLESAPKPAEAPPLPRPKNSSPELDRAMQLLDRNQPREALEIIQKFLPLFPGNPELLALAGSAAYKSDNLRLALDYWKQSLDIKPDPAVVGVYKSALRESENDKSGEKRFGTRFLLRYDGAVADSDTATAMVGILEEEFSKISLQLGCRAQERIVTIVQSRAAYMKTTGAPEWSGGAFDGKLHIPIMDRRQSSSAVRQVFAHELVHACLASIGPWPQWLHEGLAQRLSGAQVESWTRDEIRSLAKQGKLPTLTALGRSWTAKTPFEAHLAYAMALVAVNLFYEYHAGMGIRNLLNNPEALPSITTDLDKRLRE